MAKKRLTKKQRRKLNNFISSLLAFFLIACLALVLYMTGALDSFIGEAEDASTPVTGEMQVHFLDVGQGDCVLVLTETHTMLIDTGDKDDTYNQKIVDHLKKYNVSTINYLILTHPDADHIGGAPDVINNFTVEKCIMPDFVKTTQIFNQTVEALDENNVEVINANEVVTSKDGNVFYLGEARCELLAPLKDSYDDVNDASVVMRLSFGETDVLFTGDAEAESEADMVSAYSAAKLSAEVLKSGHHGSRTSSSYAFLNLVSPQYAVISCGEDNKYGHPHSETIEKYSSRNMTVYRTDVDGTVIMKTDGKNIVFTVEK